MPWGDCTGPWWKNARENGSSESCCCGRGMQMRRGHGGRQAFMSSACGMPHHAAPEEEKSQLENVARRLEEELRLVKERIEKLKPAE
ncbi:MAG TPA: DUF5320 domain-containing protein [Methanothrix sp.]|nr:DUF5320 domain-containing protein [Methanothrix sp.]